VIAVELASFFQNSAEQATKEAITDCAIWFR